MKILGKIWGIGKIGKYVKRKVGQFNFSLQISSRVDT